LKGLFPQAQLIYSSLDKDGADSFFITLEDVEKNLIQGHNLVILETDNIGFASNVASVLNGLISPVRSITLATTDFNAAFENENFSNSYKSNLKLRYATSNKPMDTLGSADFIERYQERYHVYPNKYAIRAYDLTIDLLYRLGMYGGLDQSVGNLTAAKTLENKFNYQKLPDGGFTNVSCFVRWTVENGKHPSGFGKKLYYGRPIRQSWSSIGVFSNRYCCNSISRLHDYCYGYQGRRYVC
jgi:hypothetical protein